MRQAALLTLLVSSPALACAVCGAGDDPAKGTLLTMSIIISLLPLAMLGGILAWIISSVRAAAKAEADAARAPGSQQQ